MVDAQFSIPYTVATAIINRRVFLEDFSPEAILRPDVVGLARKVTPVVREEFDKWPITVRPCEVEIVTRQGGRFARRVDYAKGNPRNPVPLAEIQDNFLACSQRTKIELGAGKALEARDMIENLERVDNVAEIAERLSGAK